MADYGFQFEQRGDALFMSRDWSRPTAWAFVIWVVVWCSMVVFFSTLGGHPLREAPWWLALPAVAGCYVALAMAVNHTDVTVRPDQIVVRHGPIPWAGSRQVDARKARAVHTRLRVVHSRSNEVHLCCISLERANGRRLTLLDGPDLTAIEMARAAAQIGTFLQIPVVND